MAYLLDANVFIDAKNRYYGFELCPGFWDWLLRRHEAGVVFSVRQVGDELLAGADTLADWAQERGDRFFLQPDGGTLAAVGTVAQWVMAHGGYTSGAANTFLQAADMYLIAHAVARGDTVVTHEVPRPSVHRVMIPTVCVGLGVAYVNPFQMLNRERARFVLPSDTAARG
jgi:predicted nucleic acid-binding protein